MPASRANILELDVIMIALVTCICDTAKGPTLVVEVHEEEDEDEEEEEEELTSTWAAPTATAAAVVERLRSLWSEIFSAPLAHRTDWYSLYLLLEK
eukprot:201984-Hanusia_phi.AAC.4